MSDPFSVEHADWLPGSAGRTSGFFAGVSAGYDQQYNVDSAYALEDEVYSRWQKSLAGLERVTGQKFDMPLDYSSINNYVRAARGEDPSFWAQAFTFQGLDASEAIKAREPFIKANDAIKQLNDPNITSMEDIINEVIKKRAEVSGRSAQVSETGGFGAMLGQFAGAVGGSFSERDPLLLGTLGFGGFGKTAAARIATEMAAISGIETAQQYGAVEPTREILGEEPGSPLLNVLFAATGAGVLRTGVEGLAKLVQRPPTDTLELTEEMRVAFEAMPQSPSARAGLHLLNMQEQFDAANPYPGSEAGTRRFIAELEDVQRVMNGQTETAIARFLPEMPVDTQKLDADSLIVQAERPVVYEQLVAAQNRLAEIDEQINRSQSGSEDLTELTVINREDVVSAHTDESGTFDMGEAGVTVRSQVQEALDKNADVNLIVEDKPHKIVSVSKLGLVDTNGNPWGIAQLVMPAVGDDVRIEITRSGNNLKDIRTARKSAVKEFKSARQQFDTALADIQREVELRERISRRETVGDLGSQTKFVEEPPGETLRHDNVEAAVASTTAASEAIDDIASGIARGVEDEDGMIDLGNGIKLPKDFTLNLEDDAGNTFTMTAETIMKDLKDDLSLEEAVKVCSIPSKGPQ